ncbi:ATP-binding cassette domain-containing protein [Streptomyces sp. PR69]|uniref:ATP-binding cassette domain-containing protein n=1 Tax=Streptomyces sp. PR69 TaxID=2984950 RepID=UPI002263C46F|nr:ATP-binding cassette domain-containing protein [Streptomyces sp. PR69]
MLQAIGLTSAYRRDRRRDGPPAVENVSFEARPGRVTALLGAPGAGKTTTLRLLLGLTPGRGLAYFRGRPLHRIAHPAREAGVLLGDVPGHPARTVRGQLRMLCAAAGEPAARADELLTAVGLAGVGHHRLGTLPTGADRRLGMAAALIGDPHSLILDEPARGLSPREAGWLFGLLHAHAARGGTVLYTTSDPKEAARNADHVVTLHKGRLAADQDAADFARTRLRPRVAVRTPHAARLSALLGREARAAQRSVEVVVEGGARLSVYGSSCAEIGETAFRHGVLLHRLTEETGDAGPAAAAAERPAADAPAAEPPAPDTAAPAGRRARRPHTGDALPPPLPRRALRGPLRPLRYELSRLLGVRTALLIALAAVIASLALSVPLARTGAVPLPRLLAAWPGLLPLPPAAFAAGLIGALSYGEEYRYPALAVPPGAVPRRLGLLLAKLAVTALSALLLAWLVAAADAQALRLVYGTDLTPLAENGPVMAASWSGLAVGCAWAGLLAAGVFRATAAGVAAVLAVPVLLAPLVQQALLVPAVRSVAGFPGRLRELAWAELPREADAWLASGLRLLAQPVGAALALSLAALVCAFLAAEARRGV